MARWSNIGRNACQMRSSITVVADTRPATNKAKNTLP